MSLFDDFYPEQLALFICFYCLAFIGLVAFIVVVSRRWRANEPIVPYAVRRPYQRIAAFIRRLLGTDGRQRIGGRRRLRVAVRVWGKCQYQKSGRCLGRVWPWQKGDPDGNGRYSHMGHADHVTPVAAGGRNFRNLVWSCYACNLEKGAATEGWEPAPLSIPQRIVDFILVVILADFPSIRDF